jgi:nucleoside-triphosphatase THEP1
MLTGKTLFDKFKELSDANASKSEICSACGYTTTTQGSGKTKYLWSTLQTALLEAQGFNMPSTRTGGHRPSFRTHVLTTNKSIMVGKCYTEMLGVEPGTPFNIEVDKGAREIILSMAD